MAKIHRPSERTTIPNPVFVALFVLCLSHMTAAFHTPYTTTANRISTRLASTTERPPTKSTSQPIHHSNDNMYDRLDLSAYEESLLNQWEDTSLQTGFDWEIGEFYRTHIMSISRI